MIGLAAALQFSVPAAGASHYSCEDGAGDAAKGEVQGETGIICGPRCADGTFQCPTDVPPGTSAQPQCMLQDADQTPYCGLLCQVDSQCPSGASCRKVTGSIEVSVCIHPLSFDQWAKTSGSRRKFTVGWPVKAGSQASGFQIARAYSALQSLKRRYSIADGDSDVLVVKELLSAASSAGAAASTAAAAAGPPAALDGVHVSAAAPSKGWAPSAWEHDLAVFGGNMARGLPGVEKEIHDTIWNVEHIENRGVATMLLRSVIMIAVVYLVGGAVYKNQTYGSSGVDAIPHIGFWKEYPQLVLDGVQYATGFGRQFMGKGSTSDFEPLSGGLSGRGF